MNIPHQKIADSVKSLIQTHPFFAGILLQQKFVSDSSIKTFAVDGENFFFNPDFADSLSFDECRAVCAHEAGHLAGGHHFRRGNRDPRLWNEATDYVLNETLAAQGFKLPQGVLRNSEFAGKSAEDAFRSLWQKREEEKKQAGKANQSKQGQGAGQGRGSGQGQSGQPNAGQSGQGGAQPSPGNGAGNQSPANATQSTGQGQPNAGQDDSNPCGEVLDAPGNAKDAAAKGKLMVEKALSIARAAGIGAGAMEREVKACKATRYDWREILNRFFTELTARDYSFSFPNKRYLQRGLILPGLRSRDCGQIVLAIDTSGSVSADEVSAMVAEMQNCLSTYGENGLSDGLRVIYCDFDVQGEETLFEGEKANPKGGGGTRFAPVFEHLKGDLQGAAALVYLTDGETMQSDLRALESLAPGFPVLWGLIRENESFNPPFGEVFRFDIHA